MKKQYDLVPCKSCGDVTCDGQCNWLRPLVWLCVVSGGILTVWFLKSLFIYLLELWKNHIETI